MIQNRIQFIVDEAGQHLRAAPFGSIRAFTDVAAVIELVTPFPVDSYVEVGYNVYDSRDVRISSFLLPTADKGADVIGQGDPLYQQCADWAVFRINVKATALTHIAKYRAGRVGIAFNISDFVRIADMKEHKGDFGNGKPLPETAADGDYYICDSYNYADSGFLWNKGGVAYYKGDKWNKAARRARMTTATLDIPVDASVLANTPQITEDEYNQIVVQFAADIAALQGQLSQLVVEGDSSVEAAQARVDANGNIFDTLKQRLDVKEAEAKFYTDNAVDEAIGELIGGAPEALNTLKELSDKVSELDAGKADATSVDAALAFKENIADNNAKLQLKADKTYVDGAISSIGDGSPKGTYATLSALQSAYPSGTTGIYVVTEDGHWYYWNGSAWADGGVYQATEIADGSITAEKIASGAVISDSAISASKSFSSRYVSQDFESIYAREELLSKIPLEESFMPYTCEDEQQRVLVSLLPQENKPEIALEVKSRNLIHVDELLSLGTEEASIDEHGTGIVITSNTPNPYRYRTLIKQLTPNTTYYYSSLSSNNQPGLGCGVSIYADSVGGAILLNKGNSDNPSGLFTTSETGKVAIAFYYTTTAPVDFPVIAYHTDVMLSESTVSVPFSNSNAQTKTLYTLLSGKEYNILFNLIKGDTLNFAGEEFVNYKLGYAAESSTPVYTINGGTPDESGNFLIPKSSFTNKKIAVFGDSNIGNYQSDGIPALLANELDAVVYNVGFGATRMSTHPAPEWDAFCMHSLADSIEAGDWTLQDDNIEDVSSSLSPSLATIKTIDWAEIDYIIISHGSNDWTNYSTKVENTENPKDYTAFKGGFRYFYDKLITKNPNLKFMLLTSPFRGLSSGQTETSDTRLVEHIDGNHHLTEYIEATKEIAQEYKIPCMDAYFEGGINVHNWEQYMPDGAHYGLEARQRIARRLANFIKLYF